MLDAVEKVCQEVLILHNSAVVASTSVTRLRELTESASLEEAFASVAIDQDLTTVGRDLADVATM
jgi:ABC-type Na+ transport system ATPase subunit NatA